MTFYVKAIKKIVPLLLCFTLLMSFVFVGCNNNSNQYGEDSFVGKNGKLQVIGNQLCNENKEPVQLRGISSLHLHLYGMFVNRDTLKWLRDDWGISVFRAAMYTEEGGYISNPSVKEKVKEAVEAAVELGIYIIIDWHTLSDGDPNEHKDKSKEFFKEMSELYSDCPNVIYEICNEPNGDDVRWANSIKPYAEEIIPVIRKSAPDSIILVGTGNWSQDVHEAADDPLEFNNVMYTCHFYAGTHGSWLRDRIEYALQKGAPIFVSEWGTSQANGSDGVYRKESIEWLDFLKDKKISWVNWSLSDKDESSAALTPTAGTEGNWSDSDLSESGLFIKYSILEKPEYTLFSDGFETSIFSKGWDSKGCLIINNTGYKGNYSVLIKEDNSLIKDFNTLAFSNIGLQFAYLASDFSDNDQLIVEGFDGNIWSALGKISKSSDWSVKTIALPEWAYNNENFKIRFSVDVKTELARAYLDDIKITGNRD